MQPFDQLTERGRVRRLHQLAINALQQYALDVQRVRLIAVHTNTLFRVDTADGAKYALRVCTPGEHTLADNLAEVTWLAALRRDTNLHTPAPVANHDNTYITIAGARGVPEARRCILFEWIPGAPLDKQLTPANYARLGAAAATLHEHAAAFCPPADFQPMPWNKVFYYPHEPVVIYEDAYRALFPARRMKIIEATLARAESLLTQLNADINKLCVLHGDLHMWNVHVYRGRLYLLDFEDLMLGVPLQDVAITLSYGRDREDYPALVAAFESGYKGVRPWPVKSPYELATLMAARTLMFINYVAHSYVAHSYVTHSYVTHSRPNPQEHIESMCGRLEKYLKNWD